MITLPSEDELHEMAEQLEAIRAACRWQVRFDPLFGVWEVHDERGFLMSQVTTWASAVLVARRGCERRRTRLPRAALTVRGWDL